MKVVLLLLVSESLVVLADSQCESAGTCVVPEEDEEMGLAQLRATQRRARVQTQGRCCYGHWKDACPADLPVDGEFEGCNLYNDSATGQVHYCNSAETCESDCGGKLCSASATEGLIQRHVAKATQGRCCYGDWKEACPADLPVDGEFEGCNTYMDYATMQVHYCNSAETCESDCGGKLCSASASEGLIQRHVAKETQGRCCYGDWKDACPADLPVDGEFEGCNTYNDSATGQVHYCNSAETCESECGGKLCAASASEGLIQRHVAKATQCVQGLSSSCGPGDGSDGFGSCCPGTTCLFKGGPCLPPLTCSIGDHVLCPDGQTQCTGNQCCPDKSTCPSASENPAVGCTQKLQTCSQGQGRCCYGRWKDACPADLPLDGEFEGCNTYNDSATGQVHHCNSAETCESDCGGKLCATSR